VDLEGWTLLRPDILFCLIMLIAAVVYDLRHPVLMTGADTRYRRTPQRSIVTVLSLMLQ